MDSMSPQKGEVDGCDTGILLIIVAAVLTILSPFVLHAG
jgi:hypothetical protein